MTSEALGSGQLCGGERRTLHCRSRKSILLAPGRPGDNFSTLGGQLGPCPPGWQRGLWVSLMSQLSGRHCAPEKVQRNLEDREREDREMRPWGLLLSTDASTLGHG